jgi:hypothetical protein
MTPADDAAPILELVHAVGLRGFNHGGLPVQPNPSGASNESAEPILALIRAAGLPGFKCTSSASTNSDARPEVSRTGRSNE